MKPGPELTAYLRAKPEERCSLVAYLHAKPAKQAELVKILQVLQRGRHRAGGAAVPAPPVALRDCVAGVV